MMFIPGSGYLWLYQRVLCALGGWEHECLNAYPKTTFYPLALFLITATTACNNSRSSSGSTVRGPSTSRSPSMRAMTGGSVALSAAASWSG